MKAPMASRAAEEVIRIEGRFYVLASSSLADDRVRVLKQGDTFAVFDRYGDVLSLGSIPHGLFHQGTRFLSRMELRLNGARPLLLSSSVLQDDILLAADLTNPDIVEDGRLVVPRDILHVFRTKFLWNGTCFERLKVANYGQVPLEASLSFEFDADFADIFEVRGVERASRGRFSPPKPAPSALDLRYDGLDGAARRLRLEWDKSRLWRAELGDRSLALTAEIAARSTETVHLRWACATGPARPRAAKYDRALADAGRERAGLCAAECKVETSNSLFDDWLNRSYADIHMMITRLPEGLYPYAGVPWFNTVFGRDGIWTAFFFLWVAPELARGVLAHLAALQSAGSDPARDSEPGKILHETRQGEMAARGEVPFGLYYGAVDSTPLFVMLAGAYLERTGDMPFLWSLWPRIEKALCWLERSGDLDGDGFVEYARKTSKGLANQGWKDSQDSVFHADGSLAEGPIALCEVQGYAFDAFRKGARMAARLGRPAQARHWAAKASALRAAVENTFWSRRLGTYALALDGRKRPCLSRTSNPGHLLFCGLPGQARARKLAEGLLAADFFTGWGVRTVAAGEARFNPMSYHNGSIWPHDNAIIAHGLARYGYKGAAARILEGLFDASAFMDLHRLPELFCGFDRREREGPTLYPVACNPQAWASAAPFMLLQSILGMSIDGSHRRVTFDHPMLPPFLEQVRLRGLRVGKGSVDILLTRHRRDVGVNVTRRAGPVEVLAVK